MPEVCPKGKYRCGTATEQCVSDILVCDGHKDCDDGSDEDEHVCSTYTHARTCQPASSCSRSFTGFVALFCDE